MDLIKHIKQVLKEEINSDLKKPFMKYEKLINKLVYEVFDEGICGFDWEIVQLHEREGLSIRIVLHFTKNSYKEFDYQRYGDAKRDLKEWIQDYLPKFNGIFIAYDTTKCEDTHKEEETEGVGGYESPAFEMKPDHEHFKHLYNESEITEKCWKGYTKKGMKTMFGKKYPNCVKIKKKKSLKESIKDILDEEVSRKYAKPTPKVEQLVYNWLNKYFDGAQMYHKKHYESTHSFEFCKNGREILDVTLYFDTDDTVFDDKRKTEERSLDRGFMSVPKNLFDDLTTDIPMRVSYLRYLLEEWFDDTYLGEIQKKMGRNDIHISELNVSSSDGDICFQPITKPDDVTEEEMIEHILKSGKYKMKDILWWEERLPGWIEQTYLEQLNGDEYRRLKGQ